MTVLLSCQLGGYGPTSVFLPEGGSGNTTGSHALLLPSPALRVRRQLACEIALKEVQDARSIQVVGVKEKALIIADLRKVIELDALAIQNFFERHVEPRLVREHTVETFGDRRLDDDDADVARFHVLYQRLRIQPCSGAR